MLSIVSLVKICNPILKFWVKCWDEILRNVEIGFFIVLKFDDPVKIKFVLDVIIVSFIYADCEV